LFCRGFTAAEKVSPLSVKATKELQRVNSGSCAVVLVSPRPSFVSSPTSWTASGVQFLWYSAHVLQWNKKKKKKEKI